MGSGLARVSSSIDNVIQLDGARRGAPGHAPGDADPYKELCRSPGPSEASRRQARGRKPQLNPALIDDLKSGKLEDAKTGGLAIEVLSSGKKRWRFRRRLPKGKGLLRLSLGLFPAYSIADAREWANKLNLQIDAGIDPRVTAQTDERLATMTVDRAHGLYMDAVRQGRSSRSKRPNKARTISDKLDMYKRDIAPMLGKKIIYDVTELDLIKLVESKGKRARIRANRLAAELSVFFGWAASLRGLEVRLEVDPSRRLSDLRFPETKRSRVLSLQEIEWFLIALSSEELDYRRAFILWLLSATRLSEVIEARSSEIVNGIWIIPAGRTKNGCEHRLALGPWGRALLAAEGEWLFPAPKTDGPRSRNTWHVAIRRIRRRMEAIGGGPVERFTPHDLRRTLRSNTKRLKIDFETAEAMLNHVKKGLERTYDRYDLDEEKRAAFAAWEREIAAIARRAGVAEQLLLPADAHLVGEKVDERGGTLAEYQNQYRRQTLRSLGLADYRIRLSTAIQLSSQLFPPSAE